jgi:hypothetical protein
MTPKIGIVEGFFGQPWSWDERESVVNLLAPAGLDFYIYAPKADPNLRRQWHQNYDKATLEQLASFEEKCTSAGVKFGVGLTPFEVFEFNDDCRSALKKRIIEFNQIGIKELAILFDDMKGSGDRISSTQSDIVNFCLEHSSAHKILMCPTYYSDDAILDRVFGPRPEHYLEELGKKLDPSVEVFWTGEEVCSKAISEGHIRRISNMIGRNIAIWDNYPVNDGPRMSERLHLRPFTGRSHDLAPIITRHAINPALQPTLSCIPILTLFSSYRDGKGYRYMSAWNEAASKILDDSLHELIITNWIVLNDQNRQDIITKAPQFIHDLGSINTKAAREIREWLAGRYIVTGEMVMTQ